MATPRWGKGNLGAVGTPPPSSQSLHNFHGIISLLAIFCWGFVYLNSCNIEMRPEKEAVSKSALQMGKPRHRLGEELRRRGLRAA